MDGEKARKYGPWGLAWTVSLPVLVCLVINKTAKVMLANTWLGLTLEGSGPMALARWIWGFTLLRFVIALALGFAVQRWLWPRRRMVAPLLALGFMAALALAGTLARREIGPFALLMQWSARAAEQGWMVLVCLWRDAVLLSLCVFTCGLLIRFAGPRLRAALVRALQWLGVLACALIGADLVYELAVGQSINLRVLVFGLFHWKDMVPMVAAEFSVGRALVLSGAIALAIGWAWRHRALARARTAGAWPPRAGLFAALTGSVLVAVPVPAVGFLEAERHAQAVFTTLYRSAMPGASDAVRQRVRARFEANGGGGWRSERARLVAAQAADTKLRRDNVVIVMLESARAMSTTMHAPHLPTMPFLDSLAGQGWLVEDMSAVIPRTAAAWKALLAGHYPLTNEATRRWATAAHARPGMRALPTLLREHGYASAFFVPTHLELLDDREVIRTLDFDHVVTEAQAAPAGTPRVNYFGVADEWLLDPMLEWSRRQVQAGRPFLATLMTNVGHHAYDTPPSWRKHAFEGVDNPVLVDYYNCLRYVDQVLERLVRGYAELGLLERTVFVFVGDHGQMFGEHGLRQTFNAIYQPGVQVPALIYAPGILRSAGVVKGPRQQIDLLPTLADLLGLRIAQAQLPGVSLFDPVPSDRALFFSSSLDGTFLAMRRGPRKYIYSYERHPMVVYDLASDPQERRPLDGVPEEELAHVRDQMLAWKEEAELSLQGVSGEAHAPHALAHD